MILNKHFLRLASISSIAFLVSCSGAEIDEQARRAEFQSAVELANACETHEQCVNVYPGCPLGCSAAVNINFQSQIEQKAASLRSASCEYSCAPTYVQCVDNKCESFMGQL